MYAVIETGGKQYRVEVGTELEVELLDVEPGQAITLDRVLLVADGAEAAVGRPVVANAAVDAEVVGRQRGDKVIAFKYRPKARRRVKKGHRQDLTRLRIADIRFNGKSAAEARRRADEDAKSERQRIEEAAARQAAADAALAAFGHQNPIGWRRWAPADGPKRLSELIGRHELGRLEFHDLYLRPNRIRDILKIWLASTPHAAACISLDRSGSPFSRRDAAVLAVLQGHLTAIRATALRTPLRPEGRPLTTREAQVVSWAAMGYRNEMIAARLFISAATVQKHLERAYEKLDAHSRAAAAARVLLPRYGDEDGRSEDDRRVPWLPRRPEPDRAD